MTGKNSVTPTKIQHKAAIVLGRQKFTYGVEDLTARVENCGRTDEVVVYRVEDFGPSDVVLRLCLYLWATVSNYTAMFCQTGKTISE